MPGRAFSLWRLADLSWRYDCATMPVGKSLLRFRPAGNYLPRREAAKDGGGIGRAPAPAGGNSVIRSAELAARGEDRKHARKSNQVRFRGSRLRYVPVGSFRPGATQTNAGARTERCCRLSELAGDIFPRESTSRADERNVVEEIERSATSPLLPRGRRRPGGTNRRPHIKSEKSPIMRWRH